MKTLFLIIMVASFIMIGCGSNNDTDLILEDFEERVIINIRNPAYNKFFYTRDMPIKLEGSAKSTNSVNLSNQIKWASSVSGDLGTGSTLIVDFEPGRHEIFAKCSLNGYEYSESVLMTVEEYVIPEKVPTKRPINKKTGQDGRILVIDKENQIITDSSTNLMWQRIPENILFGYQEALNYAKNSKLGGFSNWRLPTFDESKDIHNLYYDGRDAILDSGFVSFEANFWTTTEVDRDYMLNVLKKFGVFKYVIIQKNLGYGNAYMTEKTYVDINSKACIRLVRNAK